MHLLSDFVALLRADHGGDFALGVDTRSHHQPAGDLDDPVEERCVNFSIYVNAFDRSANLTGVQETSPHRSLSGSFQIGILADDEGILAPEFQVEVLDFLGSLAHDLLPDLGAAGEGDHAHVGMGNQVFAHLLARTRDDVEHAWGEMLEEASKPKADPGGIGSGFDHHGIASGQGGGELPGEEQQRVVPGDDSSDHPYGYLQHRGELAGFWRGDDATAVMPGELCVVIEALRRPLHIAPVLADRAAGL